MIQKVVPQASGESSKVKVKVRVNIHGIFSVSSASLVEVLKSDETEEPMETEQASDKEGEVKRLCIIIFVHYFIISVCITFFKCFSQNTYLTSMNLLRARCRLIRMSNRVREMLRKKRRRRRHERMRRWK